MGPLAKKNDDLSLKFLLGAPQSAHVLFEGCFINSNIATLFFSVILNAANPSRTNRGWGKYSHHFLQYRNSFPFFAQHKDIWNHMEPHETTWNPHLETSRNKRIGLLRANMEKIPRRDGIISNRYVFERFV